MNSTESPSQTVKLAAPIVMLGVPFDVVTAGQTIAIIGQMIESRRPYYLATANAGLVALAARDVELRRILLDAHLILCDDTPLVWASRWLGNPLPDRVASFDLALLLISSAAEKGWRVFLLGAKEDILQRAAAKLRTQHPRLQIVGSFSPPSAPLLEMDHESIRCAIKEAKPDLLLVGLGCPKQEKWINMHYRTLGVPVSIGVGATIDFLAGEIPQAPMWMGNARLEWLHRLSHEPRRLARHCVADFWVLATGLLAQWWQLQLRRRQRAARYRQSLVVAEKTGAGFELVRIPPRFDAAVVKDHDGLWKCFTTSPTHLLVDLMNVEFIDSTGVGLLIWLHKSLTASNCHFVLVAPSTAAKKGLERMRIPEMLAIAPNLDAAKNMIAERTRGIHAIATLDLSPSPKPLTWHGEIVTSNIEAVKHLTESYMDCCVAHPKRIAIDLAEVRFVDSAGVGFMLRIKKQGRLRGMEVTFLNPQLNVLNVVRALHLDQYLFGGDPQGSP
ncbi:MAG: WecB/TagA/CpsF family glycosyltransferase [Verrucomicrobia bacterium]|nr:WecB/TagA/CpsF family glycosyltransferase [Verrucomicrobiota bacterium]